MLLAIPCQVLAAEGAQPKREDERQLAWCWGPSTLCRWNASKYDN